MHGRQIQMGRRLFGIIAMLLFSRIVFASGHHGKVMFGGFPVPGATVTLSRDDQTFTTVTDEDGSYSFSNLADGAWSIQVKMLCFAEIQQKIVVSPSAPAASWELKMLPLSEIKAQTQSIALSPVAQIGPEQAVPLDTKKPVVGAVEDNQSEGAADGMLVNGSVNNGAASPFAQAMAFGNSRSNSRGLYNGGVGVLFDNSVFDARPYSLSGQSVPKSSYNRVIGLATLGGPLNIPRLLPHGPNFFAGYQWTQNQDATTQSALVPTQAERSGDFSQDSSPIFDPATGQPFPNNMVTLSQQARALLNYYPLPNVTTNSSYNFQTPILNSTHQDALQSRLDKTLNNKNQVYGTFAFQSTRTSDSNLFDFTDTTGALGLNASINWSHRFNRNLSFNMGYRFSRLSTRITPFWQDRENVSGNAGITGNNQEPMNWGPPTLSFSSGVAGLSDAQSSFDRNMTNAWSYAMQWNRGAHNVTFGGDFRRQEFNYLSQQDPRGTFAFTGAATQGTVNGVATGGSDLADFVLGVPDTSSIAYGNADKYFRESVYDVYFTDDWRLTPQLTVNAGMRWEYGAPITEIKDRLVNLDITSGFAAAAAVLASDPIGPLTGEHYPTSLIRPYKGGFEPRVGIAWRPIPASSIIIRAGYGIYYDTSVYQSTALNMAQQAPLSKSLSVENSASCPLTLANGFNTCPGITSNTFAADPDFRGGYAQNWQLTVQRDLPFSLQLSATYLGVKGTHAAQEFLPNTYAPGASDPCPACPTGFTYLASNANSTREAGQIQLRRRLHNGFTGTLQYTYSNAIDNAAALGGQGALLPTQVTPSNPFASAAPSQSASTPVIAQNWLDLDAERGRSTFNQRHLLNLQVQYTTGMGIGGGTLMSGWKGALFKEWTGLAQITAASGLPQTPVYPVAVPDTGVTGTIRPDYTGAPIYKAPEGFFLNPAAYSPPLPGQWGTAARNSITGPNEFLLNASLGRTFRMHDRVNLDLRTDVTNLLNHVAYTSWNTAITSPQFGLPAGANPMRSLQTTLRMRF